MHEQGPDYSLPLLNDILLFFFSSPRLLQIFFVVQVEQVTHPDSSLLLSSSLQMKAMIAAFLVGFRASKGVFRSHSLICTVNNKSF